MMPFANKKILLVDDSPIVREMVSLDLEDLGIEVVTLESAVALGEAIRRDRPDLVLLDVRMPGLRGDEAARLIGHLGLETPILLHSDMEEEKLAAMARDTGAGGYLCKTGDPEELAELLRPWLE